MPSASTTYQSRGMSFPLGVNVRIGASSVRTATWPAAFVFGAATRTHRSKDVGTRSHRPGGARMT